MIKAIFLDRDGVINDPIDRGDNCVVAGKNVRFTGPWKYEEFNLRNGVVEAINELKGLGFLVILITNQPDVKYGVLPAEEYERIMKSVGELPFHDIFVCNHTRHDGCECKKPKPGMLLEAARKHDIDLSLSYMVGDTENDTMAGKSAGCTTILVKHQYNDHVEADFKIEHLNEMVRLVRGN